MLAPHGIVVNAVAPGPTRPRCSSRATRATSCSPEAPSGATYAGGDREMVVTLLSDASRSVIGDTVRMTGGSGVVTFDDATPPSSCRRRA